MNTNHRRESNYCGLKSKCSLNTIMQILVESQYWVFFGQPSFSHVVFVYRSPLTICPFPPCFITALGADSNSEYSSGSGVLLSDSRESSPAASPDRSAPLQDQGDRNYRRRDSRGTSFRELDWEQPGGQQAEREEWFHGDSNQKSLEAPTQERWWGVVGGEE